VPNRIVNEALRNGALREYRLHSRIMPEASYAHSRIDFLLESNGKRCLLEVKSCTLVRKGVAIFPDAPTVRGRRHLFDLIGAKKRGYRACVMFVIQRPDPKVFMPNRDTDPDFAKALKLARSSGVEISARKCSVRNFNIELGDAVPVEL
jgi:sugar fermentation stimulation protein A